MKFDYMYVVVVGRVPASEFFLGKGKVVGDGPKPRHRRAAICPERETEKRLHGQGPELPDRRARPKKGNCARP